MDLTQYLPSLDGLQSGLTTWMRVLVMIGPIVMLLLGLYYFFLSPKEANHRAGYRFRYAMSKVAVWQFTQKLAGIAFFSLGLVLGIVMLCLIPGFKTMNAPDLVWYSVKCLMWQIILALIATVVVNATVIFRYNYNGKPRRWKKKKKADPATEVTPAAAPEKRPASGSTATPAKRPASGSAATPAKRPSSGSARTSAKRPASGSARTSAKRPSSGSARTSAKRPSSGSAAAPAKLPATPPAAKPASSNGFQRPDDL